MKLSSSVLSLAGILALSLTTAAQAQVTTKVYSGHSTTGGGTPYSGLVGTLNTPDVMFGTNTGFNWHPFGLNAFGADITGGLNVGTTGTYTFNLTSDDGSLLFIDGTQIIDNGGGHGPQTISGNDTLTAGIHSFEVQFFEDFGGSSGVDLNLPANGGVTYTNSPVPEPGAYAVMASLGLTGAAFLRRRRAR